MIWFVECASCRSYEGTINTPHRRLEVTRETPFPLRCPVCSVLEGWSALFDMSLVFEVCERLIRVYGPGPLEVGPAFDPEGEGEAERLSITLYSSLPYEEVHRLDVEVWWEDEALWDLPLEIFAHATATSPPVVQEG